MISKKINILTNAIFDKKKKKILLKKKAILKWFFSLMAIFCVSQFQTIDNIILLI